MATRKQRYGIGWSVLIFSILFIGGNGLFVANYAHDILGIPLVWIVTASNVMVWGLGLVGMSQFRPGVDDDIELRGKYQNIATMASIADHLAEDDGGDSRIRHRLVMSLLRTGAESIQIEKGAKDDDDGS